MTSSNNVDEANDDGARKAAEVDSEDLITCCVCMNLFNAANKDLIPKSLPCLHTFCIKCLKVFLNTFALYKLDR